MELLNYRRLGKPVEKDFIGLRIDYFLGRFFRFRSRNQWKKTLMLGEVSVNERPVKAAYRLNQYDQIEFFCPAAEEPEVDRDIRCLWEQDGVMAVYKPANLPMHEGGVYHNNTFATLLAEHFGPSWSAVHRLDRETSGIVLCANDTELRNELSAELRTRRMQKTYLAIAIGKAQRDTWVSEGAIGSKPDSSFRFKQWVRPDGLPSLTTFFVKEQKAAHVLLEVKPKTGRTHQIRVHSAYEGLPLVGDKKYCPDESIYLDYLDNGFTDKTREHCHFDRMCLHATALSFIHPRSKELCTVTCPMPSDMQFIWEQL